MACAGLMQKFRVGSSNQVPTSMGGGVQRRGGGRGGGGCQPSQVSDPHGAS